MALASPDIMASFATGLRTTAFGVDTAGSVITGAGGAFQISLFDYASSRPAGGGTGGDGPAVSVAATVSSDASRATADGCCTGGEGKAREDRRNGKRRLTAVPAFTITTASPTDRDAMHDWMLADRAAMLAVQGVNFAFHADAARDTVTLEPGPHANSEHIAAFEGYAWEETPPLERG